MSANDNAMTRFLFAILQQKCLKDIDWNKVAHDPILAQEITNGHAARMRYSRFRAAMLGIEPQKRKRTTTAGENRVTKRKKDDKSKKADTTASTTNEDTKSDEPDNRIKTEPKATDAAAPKVKEEPLLVTAPSPLDTPTQQHFPTNPAVSSSSSMSEMTRLLTPCSDTDIYPTAPGSASQGYDHSPSASEILHSVAPSFDFCRDPGPVHHRRQSDAQATAWHHPYSPFGLGLGMAYAAPGSGLDGEGYGGPYVDHAESVQHHHGHHNHHGGIVVPGELQVHGGLGHGVLDQGHSHGYGQQGIGMSGMVKHEEWDARSQGYH